MKRREFITLLGGAAAWPLAARAQQATMPVIGFLGAESPDLWAGRLRAFRQGLSETGYVEGRNVAIEYRWAEGQYDRLPALTADLVRRQVAVIAVPESTPGALAAKAATTAIPVVFLIATDPVGAGLVASLSQPRSNLTGVTTLNIEVIPKRLELVHELIPTATVVPLLVNPTSPTLADAATRDAQVAARSLGLQLHVLQAATDRDFDLVFATFVQLHAGALVIAPDAFFNSQSEQLAALALRHAVPMIHQTREFAAAGGLVSYGARAADLYNLLGVFTGRILLRGRWRRELASPRT
jgi:putative ABC transport system substrate-binding protein